MFSLAGKGSNSRQGPRGHREKVLRRFTSAALLSFSSFFLLPATGLTDPRDSFQPNELKHLRDGTTQPYSTLSNEDLVIRASQLRDNDISPSQRAMNYQWLSSQSGTESAVDGGKALSKLAERQLKAYLDERASTQWIRSKLMPDESGNGFFKAVDYDLKVRSNKLVIGLTYDF